MSPGFSPWGMHFLSRSSCRKSSRKDSPVTGPESIKQNGWVAPGAPHLGTWGIRNLNPLRRSKTRRSTSCSQLPHTPVTRACPLSWLGANGAGIGIRGVGLWIHAIRERSSSCSSVCYASLKLRRRDSWLKCEGSTMFLSDAVARHG